MAYENLTWNYLIFQNNTALQQCLLQPNRHQVRLQTNGDLVLRTDHQDGRTMLMMEVKVNHHYLRT